ncbi:unnamed protein product [Blepharisma stoltei]|uniref:Protein kinase domain-containing protein n=1 Tax=Blepharisma stoltei TaxID=1481888 RepID=A0AAU9K7Y0_9CILI|nr:unnamed protein product [Blepharisma stoltei]
MEGGLFAGIRKLLSGFACYQARPSIDVDNFTSTIRFDTQDKTTEDESSSSRFNYLNKSPKPVHYDEDETSEDLSPKLTRKRSLSTTEKNQPDFFNDNNICQFQTEPKKILKHFYNNKRKANIMLWNAIENNELELCAELLDEKVYGDQKAQLSFKGKDNKTPLHRAVEVGNIKILDLLLEKAEIYDLNAQDNFLQTPLHLACKIANKNIAKILINVGARTDIEDINGKTPFEIAKENAEKSFLATFYKQTERVFPDSPIPSQEDETIEIQTFEESEIEQMMQRLSSPFIPNDLGKEKASKVPVFDEEEKIEKKKVTASDFEAISQLGKGSFGEVFLVRKICTDELFAMKILRKNKVIGQNLVKYAFTERNVMSYFNHPFIVGLKYAFQTSDKLFLILDYCPGGDLTSYIQQNKKFDEKRARIYLCEILLALEELHKRDIIYRDLKPDNVVLDAQGHTLLTDFGLSKEGVYDNDSAKSFCGSVAYLAPEMLKRKGHGKAVDWYLLGVLLYEMLTGAPPYYASNREQLFYNIQNAKLKLPAYLSPEAKSLLTGLLERDPSRRLGSHYDAEDIKRHEFFSGINWAKVIRRELKPPKPNKKMIPLQNIPQYKVRGRQSSPEGDSHRLEGWTFIGDNVNMP